MKYQITYELKKIYYDNEPIKYFMAFILGELYSCLLQCKDPYEYIYVYGRTKEKAKNKAIKIKKNRLKENSKDIKETEIINL